MASPPTRRTPMTAPKTPPTIAPAFLLPPDRSIGDLVCVAAPRVEFCERVLALSVVVVGSTDELGPAEEDVEEPSIVISGCSERMKASISTS